MTADNTPQPDYVNAVLRCWTRLDPYELLKLTQAIEQNMGRPKNARPWSARIIDIDILVMQGLHLQDTRLTLPHPGLLHRPFVLHPLAEIAPHFVLDEGQTAAAWAATIEDHWRTRKLDAARPGPMMAPAY